MPNSVKVELLLTIVVHCLLNKSLKKIDFAKKLVTCQLPADSGGIRGILELFIKVFKIKQ